MVNRLQCKLNERDELAFMEFERARSHRFRRHFLIYRVFVMLVFSGLVALLIHLNAPIPAAILASLSVLWLLASPYWVRYQYRVRFKRALAERRDKFSDQVNIHHRYLDSVKQYPGEGMTIVFGGFKLWRGGHLATLGAIGRSDPACRGPRPPWH